jgi:hypothetical protein
MLADGGWEGEGWYGGLATGLTEARGAPEQPGNSGEVVAVVELSKGVF